MVYKMNPLYEHVQMLYTLTVDFELKPLLDIGVKVLDWTYGFVTLKISIDG